MTVGKLSAIGSYRSIGMNSETPLHRSSIARLLMCVGLIFRRVSHTYVNQISNEQIKTNNLTAKKYTRTNKTIARIWECTAHICDQRPYDSCKLHGAHRRDCGILSLLLNLNAYFCSVTVELICWWRAPHAYGIHDTDSDTHYRKVYPL